MAEKVCRACHRFVKEGVCPVCKGTNFSWSWKGIVIVNDPNDSTIAKHMGITVPGRYCILVK